MSRVMECAYRKWLWPLSITALLCVPLAIYAQHDEEPGHEPHEGPPNVLPIGKKPGDSLTEIMMRDLHRSGSNWPDDDPNIGDEGAKASRHPAASVWDGVLEVTLQDNPLISRACRE